MLRHPHGLLRAEAELARRLLLQRRGRERRRRVAAALFAIDAEHREHALGRFAERTLHVARLRFAGETELFDLGAAVFDELARKFLRGMFELGVYRPVFPRDECRNLILALADHAQGGALHAARGQPRAHLLPEQRTQVEAHEKVESAAAPSPPAPRTW